jgi:hypothetical protein
MATPATRMRAEESAKAVSRFPKDLVRQTALQPHAAQKQGAAPA